MLIIIWRKVVRTMKLLTSVLESMPTAKLWLLMRMENYDHDVGDVVTRWYCYMIQRCRVRPWSIVDQGIKCKRLDGLSWGHTCVNKDAYIKIDGSDSRYCNRDALNVVRITSRLLKRGGVFRGRRRVTGAASRYRSGVALQERRRVAGAASRYRSGVVLQERRRTTGAAPRYRSGVALQERRRATVTASRYRSGVALQEQRRVTGAASRYRSGVALQERRRVTGAASRYRSGVACSVLLI